MLLEPEVEGGEIFNDLVMAWIVDAWTGGPAFHSSW